MAVVSPVPLSFLPVYDGRRTILVQKTVLTNHQFDGLRARGAETPFGLIGPSKEVSLALLARGGDPQAFLRKVKISAGERRRLQVDLKELTSSRPLVVGSYTVFRVTDQPSRPGFEGPNQPRVDLEFHNALWAYDVYAAAIAPGMTGRLLTHQEWDLVSGVTEGIECATPSGGPTDEEANLRNRIGKTTDVGSYPGFRGFDDLIGNVWELVLPDRPDQYPGLRGWAWDFGPDNERGVVSAYRYGVGVDRRLGVTGARGVLVP